MGRLAFNFLQFLSILIHCWILAHTTIYLQISPKLKKSVMHKSVPSGQPLWDLPVLVLPLMPFFNLSDFAGIPGTQATGSSPASHCGSTTPFMNARALAHCSFAHYATLPIVPGVLPLREMFRRLYASP